MAVAKKKLSRKANENANVTIGTSKNQETLKKGIPLDHSAKHLGNNPSVGVSLGTTINMGDYESLRVDVWLTDVVADNETVEQAYNRVTTIVSDTLGKVANKYLEDR